MVIELKKMLNEIVKDDNRHAKWLNTLSYLEYIGFRKLVKSQHSAHMNSDLLKHAIEEGRHALFLKKLAIRVGGAAFDYYETHTLFCLKEANAYFQGLDQACETELLGRGTKHYLPKMAYLYVTLLVEERAMSVYHEYDKALELSRSKLSLKALLAEEVAHLQSVRAELKTFDPNFEKRLTNLKLQEVQLFKTFINALCSELQRPEISYDIHGN